MADEGFQFIKPQVSIQPVEAPDMMTPYLQAVDSINKFTGELHGIVQKIDESALQAERLTLQGLGRDTHSALREKVLDPKNFGVNSLQQYQSQAQATNETILQNASPQNRTWAKAMLSEYTDANQNVIATHVNELTRNNMLMAGLEGMEGQFDDADKASFNGDMELAKIAQSQGKNTIQNLVANGLLHPISAVNREREANFNFETSAYSGQIARHFESLTNIQQKDYSSLYNTKLTPDQEQQFESWAAKQQPTAGRDVTKDLYNYDLKGWWLANKGASLTGAHLTDKFKKPNHPTFSNESIYEGTPSLEGGKNTGGTWDGEKFIPAPKQDWISDFEKQRGTLEPRVYQAVKTDYFRQQEEWKQQNNINAINLNDEKNNLIAQLNTGAINNSSPLVQSYLNKEAIARPETLPLINRELQNAEQFGIGVKVIRYMSNADAEKYINAVPLKAGDLDYAAKLKLQSDWRQMLHQRNVEFIADPAGFISGSKIVQDAVQRYQTNPNDPMEKQRLDNVILNQERMIGSGLTLKGGKQFGESHLSLIGHDDATKFIQNLPTQMSDRLQQIVGLMESHKGNEGIVMNDLLRNGINYATPTLIKVNNSPSARPYLDYVAEASKTRTPEEIKGLSNMVRAGDGHLTIEKLEEKINLDKQTQIYLSTLAGMQGDTEDATNKYIALRTSTVAQLLAHSKTLNEAMDLSGKLMNPDTKFGSIDGHSFLLPDSLEFNQVKHTLSYLQNEIQKPSEKTGVTALYDFKGGVDIKPWMTDAHSTMSKDKLGFLIAETSHFSNNSMGDGLILMDSFNFPISAKGQSIEVKYKDMLPGMTLSHIVNNHSAKVKAQEFIKSDVFKMVTSHPEMTTPSLGVLKGIKEE